MMADEFYRRGAGIFEQMHTLQGALNELQSTGFPMDRVSAIARDHTSTRSGPTVVPNKAQEGATTGAIAGGTIGGLMGLIAGLGTMAAVPGVGPIVLIGVAATALASTLSSGVMGAAAGGLLGAFLGYGVPQKQALAYQERIHQGGYLLMIEGTDAELLQAEPILHRWQIEDWHVFDVPANPPAPSLSHLPH